MTTRTYTTKSGTTFEWEETQEFVQYIKEMHQNNVTDTSERGQNTSEKIKEN